MNLHEKTNVLVEALPYIKKFRNKIVVVKFGGNAMSEMEHVIEDIVLLEHIGIRPVVVHGGGPEIDSELKKNNIKPRFVDGLRYTDEIIIKVVKKVFAKINKEIVNKIKSHGAKAINAKNCIRTMQKNQKLGLVGDITSVDDTKLLKAVGKDFIPVISSIGTSDDGKKHNINADTAASHIAVALKAEKLTILTNVDGILIGNRILTHIDISHAIAEIKNGNINKGMIPKVEACIYAVKNKCPKAHLINGLIPHSLLLEIFTDKGVGTEIVYRNGYQKNNQS